MRPGELLDADLPAVGVAARRPRPAVASAGVIPVLAAGPVDRTGGVVVSAGSTGLVVELPAGVVLVARRGAVRLPLSILVADVPRLTAGAPACVRADGLHLGHPDDRASVVLAVVRWFDVSVALTAPYDTDALDALDAAVAAHDGADALLDADAAPRLVRALVATAGTTAASPELGAAVAGLIGRGGGLTPAGDDVLAGALAALSAVSSPVLAPLAAAVAAHTSGRTTTLSAALLAHAARAEVVEPARGLLLALATPARSVAIGDAAAPLLALGHTSGHHLAEGIAIGARAAVAA
jgi:hypothetical protein